MAIPQSGDFPAQPISSRLSASGAALGQFQLLSCTLTLLVRHGLPALFFGSGPGGDAPVAFGHLQAVVGKFAAGKCSVPLGDKNPVLLPTGDQH